MRAAALTTSGVLALVGALLVTTGPTSTAASPYASPSNATFKVTQSPLDSAKAALGDAGENEQKVLPADAVVYAPNSVSNTYSAALAAAKVPQLGGTKAWKQAGPFGVNFTPGIGPGVEGLEKVGGIGTAVAVDRTDPDGNTAYFGTHGGLYKTTDGGKTEKNLSDGKLPRTDIGAIAIDPTNHNTVYVGTGVALLTISDDATGVGMYVSRDGGKTFSRPVKNVGGYGVTSITTSGTSVLVGTNAGLYRSTDKGASFSRVALPTNAGHTAAAPDPYGNWIQSIAVRPDATNEVTLDVGFGYGMRLGPNGKPLAPGNGLYRSTANGAPGTWHYLASNSQLTNPTASNDPLGRISLAYGTAPGQGSTMWALVQDAGYANGDELLGLGIGPLPELGVDPAHPGELGGLYRSSDDAGSWAVQATTESLLASLNTTENALFALGEYPGVQATYNNWVQTDPLDPNRVYFGLEEAYEGEYGLANPTDVAVPANGALLTKVTVMERYADPCGFYTSVASGLVGGTGAQCPSTSTGIAGGPSTHPDQHAAAVVLTDDGRSDRIYSANDGGFFVDDSTLDVGGLVSTGNAQAFSNQNWRSANTASTNLPYHATFWTNDRIIVGLQDNGTAVVDKNGRGTEYCGGDGVDVFPGPTADSLFCTHFGDAVEYVTGNGKNSAGISPQTITPYGLSPMAQDPDPRFRTHLIIGGRDVQELTDVGDANPINSLTGAGDGSAVWNTVYDAGASPQKGGGDYQDSAFALKGALAYVGTCGMCRSSYGDTSTIHSSVLTDVKPGCTATYGTKTCWHTAKGKGLPKRRINAIAFDQTHPNTVYVGLQDVSLVGYDPKIVGTQRVMVSSDRGEHFTDVSGNLPLTNVNQLIVRDTQLIAATDVGVFVAARTATGASTVWHRLGSGLPAITVKDIRLNDDGSKMVAAVFGRGAWTYDFGSPAKTSTLGSTPGKGSTGGGTGTGTGGHLASTGLPAGLAILGLLLLSLGVLTRRRRA